MARRKKTTYYEFVGGFLDGVVTKPAKGLTQSRKVAMQRKVKGTRLRKLLLAKGRKKSWWDRLSKKEKKYVKTGAVVLGTLALVGASGEVARRWQQQKG